MIGQQARGEFLDFGRHRGREEQRLPFFGQFFQDAFQIRHKAHIEHPVGFVQHERIDVVEPNAALLKEVQQASGRSDTNVHAPLQSAHLSALADTTEDGRDAELEVFAVDVKAGRDLRRQFPRRTEHQHARRFSAWLPIGEFQFLQDWNSERGGLAGAGLGASEQVLAFEQGTDGRGLNRRRRVVAFGMQGALDRRNQLEIVERFGKGFGIDFVLQVNRSVM